MKDKILFFFLILLSIQPIRSIDGLDNSSLWLDSDELVTYGIQSYEIIKRESVIPPDYAWFRFPTHHPEKVNWTLDVRLYRVDGEPNLISREILNITYATSGFSWGVRLPEEAPAIYRFGVIRKDNLDSSEGVLITTVNVTELNLSRLIRLKLVLDKTEYRPNEDITYTTINLGDHWAEINPEFSIEKKVDSEWVHVKQNGRVRLVFVSMPDYAPPNSERSFTIRMSQHYKPLNEGRYRIVRKWTRYDRAEKKSYVIYQLNAEFNVVQKSQANLLYHYLQYILYSLLTVVALYIIYMRTLAR